MFFQKPWFKIIDAAPAVGGQIVRYWDRAATQPTERTNPDWTVGLKLMRTDQGEFIVLDVCRFRDRPLAVKEKIKAIASQDGLACRIFLEEDPGQAGKAEVGDLIRALSGYAVFTNRVTTSKITRALPASAQAEAGNIKVVRATWNDSFLRELEGFHDEDQLPKELRRPDAKDDQVDAFSGAFNMLALRSVPRIR